MTDEKCSDEAPIYVVGTPIGDQATGAARAAAAAELLRRTTAADPFVIGHGARRLAIFSERAHGPRGLNFTVQVWRPDPKSPAGVRWEDKHPVVSLDREGLVQLAHVLAAVLEASGAQATSGSIAATSDGPSIVPTYPEPATGQAGTVVANGGGR